MKLYVASSWRNIYYPMVVELARAAGHEAYDFRNPGPEFAAGGGGCFSWGDVDPEWKDWTFEQYRDGMGHPAAVSGFEADKRGLDWADAVLLVMPAGRSAHLELGYCVGKAYPAAILYPTDVPFERGEAAVARYGHTLDTAACAGCAAPDDVAPWCSVPDRLVLDFEPELMAGLADDILIGTVELVRWLGRARGRR